MTREEKVRAKLTGCRLISMTTWLTSPNRPGDRCELMEDDADMVFLHTALCRCNVEPALRGPGSGIFVRRREGNALRKTRRGYSGLDPLAD